MDQGSHHGVQDAGDGQQDGGEVQRHGKGQVAFDGEHHPTGQPEQVGQLPDIVIDQGDVSRVHGDVAAHTPHGDAHMGLFQGRGIIDAVPDHAHPAPLFLAGADPVELILRQASGLELVDVQEAGDVAGGVLVVPGEEHRGNAGLLDPLDDGGRPLPEGVGQGQKARQTPALRQEDDGTALRPEGLRRRLGLRPHGNALPGQQLQAARRQGPPLHRGQDTPARDHLKVLGLGGRGPVSLPVAADHRPAQGVLRPELGRGRPGIQPLLLQPLPETADRRHPRRAVGQGPGLVEGDVGDAGEPFQGVPLPDQEAVAGGVADGGHDGGGGGQHQGAGAENHQNGHCPDDLPAEEPGEGRRRQGGDHDPGGPTVGRPHDLGLPCVGRLDQAYHALDGAVLPYPGGPHVEGPELVHCAAGDLVPRPLVHGQGFPCHHRLIDGGLPCEDDPVHRDHLSRQHPQNVPHGHLLGGDHRLPGPVHPPGGAGRQADQLLNARPGPGHGQLLQQAAQLHDEGHLSGGEVLPDGHRGHQGDGDQHIGLDVEGRHQTDKRLQKDGHPAEHNGGPSHVKGKGREPRHAGQQGQP